MALSRIITLTVMGHAIRLSSPIKLYQNDQLYLIFEINKYGVDVEGKNNQDEVIMPINALEANLIFETPLGIDTKEPAEIIDNYIVFHLKSRYTQHVGISKMQIQLTDKNCCQITLPEFEFEVKENIYDNPTIMRRVLLADENNNLLVDEGGNYFNTEIEVLSGDDILSSGGSISDIATKQIQDYGIDTEISGSEDILIQDNGVTKRVKVNKLMADNVDLTNYYTKQEVKNEIKDNNIFTTDMTTVSTLGGISAGTDLNNMSVQEILTKLLFPYVAPTLSASLTYSPSGNTFEYGTSIEITAINGNVTKKSEPIVNIKFLDSTIILSSISDGVTNGGSYKHNFTTPVVINSNLSNSRFRFSVIDGSGKTYYANTTSINFYYPYYFGVIDVDQEITNDLFTTLTKKVEAKGNKTNNYTTNYQRMLIAYPKSYGMLTKILDANSFDVTGTFVRSEFNVIGLDGTSQQYYVYVNNASTVSNFKITFQY